MPVDIIIPEVGESVTEVQITQWHKQKGDHVQADEPLAELETEKATVDLPAPASGRLDRILKQPGESASPGEVIGILVETDDAEPHEQQKEQGEPGKARSATKPAATGESSAPSKKDSISPAQVEDEEPSDRARATPHRPQAKSPPRTTPPDQPAAAPGLEEELVPITPLRRTVARRLVEAQQSTAPVTTFNEFDLSEVLTLRREQQESFRERHEVKLGLMSFFVKAVTEALTHVPQMGAELRGDALVYRKQFDIGVAVSTDKGLVVPVLRDAGRLSFAEIERAIAEFASRARKHCLDLDDLQGGTFTITNGGVYGSLWSTPIINPPQCAILGLHAIQERPVAWDGQVMIRPMMYVALTYDHRVADGREAVLFLGRIKETIEHPVRLLLDV